MRLQMIRQVVTRIKTHLAESSRKAERSNREFVEFWYSKLGS
jgi:hypothetical protein